MHFIDAASGINESDTSPFQLGQLTERFANEAMELQILVFEAAVSRCGAGSLARASYRRCGIEPEYDCSIGGKPLACDAIELADKLDAKAASGALVGERGVGEAIAQDPRAFLQGWANHCCDDLGASGFEHEKLCQRQRWVRRIEKQVA